MSRSDSTYVLRATCPSALARPEAAPLCPAPTRPTGVRPTYAYWGGENLYVNLTSRCSSACVFCLRESTWEVFGSDLYLGEDDEPAAEDVIAALAAEIGRANWATPRAAEVVFTGLGEPTVRLDVLLKVVRWLSANGVASRVDTNGHASLLHPDRAVVAELTAAGLDRVSVSLNAPDAASYDELCRPSHPGAFAAMLDFIRDSAQAGLETTATMVGIPGLPVGPVAELAGKLGATFRVRPYLAPRGGR